MDITLDGVLYHQIADTTVEQDDIVLREIRTLDKQALEPAAGEDAKDYSLRILSLVIQEGRAARILGATLIEDGAKEWTPEMASRVAQRIRSTTDPAEKAAIRDLMVPLLADFFALGLLSVTISQRFSETLRNALEQPETEEPSTSGSGRSWFASLRAVISRWLARLRAGLSARRSSPSSRS